MRRTGFEAAMGGFILAAALSTPVWGANPARPGTVNYVEGPASIGTQALDSKSVGLTELQAGQSLTTSEKGKAEVLLTPGVFLRVGDNSSVKMITPGLADTQVRVEKGRATVEVAEIHKENILRITEDDATAELLKTGLYDFDADHKQIRVFDGKAVVREGGQEVNVKGGREVVLNASGPLKAQKFNKKAYQDDFYRWGSLRSSYLAEANVDAARIYYPSTGWVGSGWYWDPWFGAYTYIPGSGVFYSPFGWGFYSPGRLYGAPLFYYPRYHHHFDHDYRRWGPGPHYGYGFRGQGYEYGHYHGYYDPSHGPRAPYGGHAGSGMGAAHAYGGSHGGRHR